MSRKRSFAVLCAVLSSLAATGSTVSGCSGDKCLADGENCSSSYLQANGKTAYICCNGQVCQTGPGSGVLICRL